MHLLERGAAHASAAAESGDATSVCSQHAQVQEHTEGAGRHFGCARACPQGGWANAPIASESSTFQDICWRDCSLRY